MVMLKTMETRTGGCGVGANVGTGVGAKVGLNVGAGVGVFGVGSTSAGEGVGAAVAEAPLSLSSSPSTWAGAKVGSLVLSEEAFAWSCELVRERGEEDGRNW